MFPSRYSSFSEFSFCNPTELSLTVSTSPSSIISWLYSLRCCAQNLTETVLFKVTGKSILSCPGWSALPVQILSSFSFWEDNPFGPFHSWSFSISFVGSSHLNYSPMLENHKASLGCLYSLSRLSHLVLWLPTLSTSWRLSPCVTSPFGCLMEPQV